MNTRGPIPVLLVALTITALVLLLRGGPSDAPTSDARDLAPLAAPPAAPRDRPATVPPGAGDQLVERSSAREDASTTDRATVRGVVIDVATGNPVGGVAVRWTRIAPMIDHETGVKWVLLDRVRDIKARYDRELFQDHADRTVTVTDADGRFELADVAPGDFWIRAAAPSWYQTRHERRSIGARETLDSIQVPVRRGARVLGRVLDPRGEPVADAEVNLFYPLSLLSIVSRESLGTRKEQTRTDDDGSFALHAVRPGSGYFLYVKAPSGGFTHVKGLDVTPERDTRVDVIVPDAGLVWGRVTGPNGAPVAGAQIRGVRMEHAFDMLFENDVGWIDGVSDDDGIYRIEGLPAGVYGIYATAPGHAPAHHSQVSVGELTATRLDLELPAGSFIAGEVVDEEGRPVADAYLRVSGGMLMVPATPASTFSASGRGVPFEPTVLPDELLDEMSGQQLRQFRRELFRAIGFGGGDDLPDDGVPRERPFNGRDLTYLVLRFEARTDDRGRFRVDGLRSDEAYFIWVHHERLADRVVRGVVPGTDDLRIVLTAPSGLAGVVLDHESGDPVPTFTLRARNLFGFDKVERRFATDDGSFELGDLNPGRYRYSIVADGYEELMEQTADVSPGAVTGGLVHELERGATVAGVVLEAATERPVVGARVEARGRADFPALRDLLPEIHGQATTGDDGAFVLQGVGVGDRVLTVSHPDFVAAKVEVGGIEPSERRDVAVRLRRGGEIEGVVLDRRDRPVSGIDVMVERSDRSIWRQAVSSRDGRFSVRGLSAGRYGVTTLDLNLRDGDLIALVPQMLSGLRPERVDVEEGRVAKVTVHVGADPEGATVTGHVLERGEPVQGVFVTLLIVEAGTPLGLRSDLTDERGRYEVAGVEPGRYVARLAGPPLSPDTVRIPVDIPDQDDVVLDLAVPGNAITGRIVSIDGGRPLPGVRIHGIDPESRRPLGDATSESDGRFLLRRIADGRYDLRVRGVTVDGAGYGGASVEDVALQGDQLVDVGDVVLHPGATVRGVVRDQDGLAVPRAWVFFRPAGEQEVRIADATTDRDGHFERDGLTPGRYLVTARTLGSTSPSVEVTADATVAAAVELVLEPSATVRVLVTDEQGAPLDDAKVTLGEGERASPSVESSVAAGLHVFTGVPNGPHRLTVNRDGHREWSGVVDVARDPTSVTVRLERP